MIPSGRWAAAVCLLAAAAGCSAEVSDGEAQVAEEIRCGRRGCRLPHAGAQCRDGYCEVARCHQGYADCNGDPRDGCEVDISRDARHCGACEARCPRRDHARRTCEDATCGFTCRRGFSDCDGDLDNGCETRGRCPQETSSDASCGDANASEEDASVEEDVPEADVPAPPQGPVVRVVYVVPSDKEENTTYVEKLGRAILHVQRFIYSELGDGRTFALSSPIVEVRRSARASSYYASTLGADAGAASWWYNAVNDGFALTGGYFNDPNNIWLYYVDADTACGQIGGAAAAGVAAFPANDLRGVAGEAIVPTCPNDPPYAPPQCRWVGGMAHELGHALGLAHPPGCDAGDSSCDAQALMWLGYSIYPSTYLRADERPVLRMSPFITERAPHESPFDCNAL